MMSRFVYMILFAAAICAAVSGAAWAQMDGPGPGDDGGPGGPPPGGEGGPGGPPPGGEGMLGPGQHGLLGLLRNEKVQKELNLTDEQKKNIEKLSQEMRPQRPGKPGERPSEEPSKERPDRDAMRKKMDERMQQIEKKLADILKSEQLARLKQIQLQVSGVAALSTPEVVKALELTDTQQKKLTAISDRVRQQMFQQGGDRPHRRNAKSSGAMEKMRKIQKDAMTKALQVLTADQRRKFEELKGQKCDLDLSSLNRPRERRDPPPRGEGGW